MFGFHLKEISLDEIKKIQKNKCNLIQIFADQLKDTTDLLNKNKIKNIHIVVHSSFIINISQHFRPNSYTVLKCIEEIKEAMKYHAIGYVLHTGTIRTKINMTSKQAFYNMINTLIYISQKLNLDNNDNFTLFLELLAGSNNDIIYDLKNKNNYLSLKYFNDIIKQKKVLRNLKYCLDTCHIFASGYHLDTLEGIKKYFLEFDKLIGIKNIGLIHLNDSYHEFNSRKDKHEILGEGKIGNNLKYIYQLFIKLDIPIIIEVSDINKNMKLIKKK